MSDPVQTNITDRMIARLEEANKRSYKQLRGADQNSPTPEQNTGHDSSDRQPAQKRRPSRPILWFFALAGLIAAATVYVTAFVWEPSYGDTAKSIIARLANVSILGQPARDDAAPPQPVIPPEVERRLQGMADELADARRQIEQLKARQDEVNRNNAVLAARLEAGQEQLARENAKLAEVLNAAVAKMAGREEAVAARVTELADAQRQIEQLKAGQDEINRNSAVLAEQFKARQEQVTRDNAKVVDQLKAALAEMTQQEAAIGEQMRATQQKLAEATSPRPISPARKPFRRKRLSSPRTRR
jgi:hypothetical protein